MKNIAQERVRNASANRAYSLDLSGLELTELPGGIEGLDLLEDLNLQKNRLCSVEPLAGLTNLKQLWLDENQIVSIEPLKNLKNLRRATFSRNLISDFSPLSNAEMLFELNASSNRLVSVESFSSLLGLENLFLDENQIASIEPLAGLVKLTELSACNNRILDLSPISDLKKLKFLDLTANDLHPIDFEFFANFKDLERLFLFDNRRFLVKYQIGDRSFELPVRKNLFQNGAKIFISYSHIDTSYRVELEKHLKTLEYGNYAESWSDRKILPGTEWDKIIKRELADAHIVIFLVSIDFLNSNYIREVEMVMAKHKAKFEGSMVVPIILRPCGWDQKDRGSNEPTFFFSKFNVLPPEANPISISSNIELAWHHVYLGLKEMIEKSKSI